MTADAPRNADDFCYRHPDRRSYVLCQRCLRTICPECQTPGAVGVICPECLREQKSSRSPAQKRAERRWGRGGGIALTGSGSATVTTWILGITAGAYLLLELLALAGVNLKGLFAFVAITLYPQVGVFQPWRLLTGLLVHSGLLHVALNLLSIWMIGRLLEPMLGRWRFLALYLLSGVGGFVAVALLAFDTTVVGASGALFGLLGALVVIGRHLGGNVTGILVILGINLIAGVVFGGISWQAHVGGLLTGVVIGFAYANTRRADQQRRQTLLLGAVGAGLLVLLVIAGLIYL